MAASYKSKHTLTRNHAPWYLSKQDESLSPHKTYRQMFTAALLISAKTWKNEEVLQQVTG